MNTFRKGDVVTVQGTIDSGFIHEGKIKVRVEPYSDVYADVADIKMVTPVIVVGDEVTCPSEGYKSGKVLAIIDDYCWVKLDAPPSFSPPGEGFINGIRVSWPIACVNRVDPPAEPADAAPLSTEEAA